jgi:hypothetical protein
MTLSDDVLERIESLSERGDALLEDRGDWRAAAAVWSQALDLLPDPKTQWEAALCGFAQWAASFRGALTLR